MNKKSQFYILTAVILLAITFGLFTVQKTVPRPSGTFDLLVSNYMKEAPLAANSGDLEGFTRDFYDFALTREGGFEMMYAFASQGNVSVLSLIKSRIFINQFSLSFNDTITLTGPEELTVSIGSEQYIINTSSQGLKAIFLLQKENSRQVRIE